MGRIKFLSMLFLLLAAKSIVATELIESSADIPFFSTHLPELVLERITDYVEWEDPRAFSRFSQVNKKISSFLQSTIERYPDVSIVKKNCKEYEKLCYMHKIFFKIYKNYLQNKDYLNFIIPKTAVSLVQSLDSRQKKLLNFLDECSSFEESVKKSILTIFCLQSLFIQSHADLLKQAEDLLKDPDIKTDFNKAVHADHKKTSMKRRFQLCAKIQQKLSKIISFQLRNN